MLENKIEKLLILIREEVIDKDYLDKTREQGTSLFNLFQQHKHYFLSQTSRDALNLSNTSPVFTEKFLNDISNILMRLPVVSQRIIVSELLANFSENFSENDNQKLVAISKNLGKIGTSLLEAENLWNNKFNKIKALAGSNAILIEELENINATIKKHFKNEKLPTFILELSGLPISEVNMNNIRNVLEEPIVDFEMSFDFFKRLVAADTSTYILGDIRVAFAEKAKIVTSPLNERVELKSSDERLFIKGILVDLSLWVENLGGDEIKKLIEDHGILATPALLKDVLKRAANILLDSNTITGEASEDIAHQMLRLIGKALDRMPVEIKNVFYMKLISKIKANLSLNGEFYAKKIYGELVYAGKNLQYEKESVKTMFKSNEKEKNLQTANALSKKESGALTSKKNQEAFFEKMEYSAELADIISEFFKENKDNIPLYNYGLGLRRALIEWSMSPYDENLIRAVVFHRHMSTRLLEQLKAKFNEAENIEKNILENFKRISVSSQPDLFVEAEQADWPSDEVIEDILVAYEALETKATTKTLFAPNIILFVPSLLVVKNLKYRFEEGDSRNDEYLTSYFVKSQQKVDLKLRGEVIRVLKSTEQERFSKTQVILKDLLKKIPETIGLIKDGSMPQDEFRTFLKILIELIPGALKQLENYLTAQIENLDAPHKALVKPLLEKMKTSLLPAQQKLLQYFEKPSDQMFSSEFLEVWQNEVRVSLYGALTPEQQQHQPLLLAEKPPMAQLESMLSLLTDDGKLFADARAQIVKKEQRQSFRLSLPPNSQNAQSINRTSQMGSSLPSPSSFNNAASETAGELAMLNQRTSFRNSKVSLTNASTKLAPQPISTFGQTTSSPSSQTGSQNPSNVNLRRRASETNLEKRWGLVGNSTYEFGLASNNTTSEQDNMSSVNNQTTSSPVESLPGTANTQLPKPGKRDGDQVSNLSIN